MDTKLIVSASPHLRSEETTAGLMANVIVALCPCGSSSMGFTYSSSSRCISVKAAVFEPCVYPCG